MKKAGFIKQLEEALKKIEETKGKPFIEHFIERAYAEDAVAIALAKKILPDLSEVDAEVKARVMQLLVDKKDVPEGSLTFGEGVKDEGKTPPVAD